MKKRILALVLTAVMVCALPVVAGAALVPSASVATAPSVSGAVSSDGTKIPSTDITVTAVQNVDDLPAAAAEQLKKAHEEINSAKNVADFLSKFKLADAVKEVLSKVSAAIEDLRVHSMFDVSASGTAAEILAEKGSVDISFSIPGVRSGDPVVALHRGESDWDVRPCTVANGKVTVTFDSLSPVVFLVDGATTAPTGAGSVTSPQTSDISFEGVLICGVLVCAAALVYCLKRRQAA